MPREQGSVAALIFGMDETDGGGGRALAVREPEGERRLGLGGQIKQLGTTYVSRVAGAMGVAAVLGPGRAIQWKGNRLIPDVRDSGWALVDEGRYTQGGEGTSGLTATEFVGEIYGTLDHYKEVMRDNGRLVEIGLKVLEEVEPDMAEIEGVSEFDDDEPHLSERRESVFLAAEVPRVREDDVGTQEWLMSMRQRERARVYASAGEIVEAATTAKQLNALLPDLSGGKMPIRDSREDLRKKESRVPLLKVGGLEVLQASALGAKGFNMNAFLFGGMEVFLTRTGTVAMKIGAEIYDLAGNLREMGVDTQIDDKVEAFASVMADNLRVPRVLRKNLAKWAGGKVSTETAIIPHDGTKGVKLVVRRALNRVGLFLTKAEKERRCREIDEMCNDALTGVPLVGTLFVEGPARHGSRAAVDIPVLDAPQARSQITNVATAATKAAQLVDDLRQGLTKDYGIKSDPLKTPMPQIVGEVQSMALEMVTNLPRPRVVLSLAQGIQSREMRQRRRDSVFRILGGPPPEEWTDKQRRFVGDPRNANEVRASIRRKLIKTQGGVTDQMVQSVYLGLQDMLRK